VANVIVTSTNYNDLHKRVNPNLQFISEWFEVKQLVLNKSKKFAITLSLVKTPMHTRNIIIDNQNFLLQNQLILLMILLSYLFTLI